MRLIPKTLEAWLTCRKCRLAKTRRSVVLGRGQLPADILFVGIGPGTSEDVLGQAFVGPSGKIMNQAVEDAGQKAGYIPRCYYANLVCCRPCDDRKGDNRDPLDDEMTACRPRLTETVALVRPKRIVLLGQTVQQEGLKLFPDGDSLPHPASILYGGGNFIHAVKTVAYQRFWMAMWAIFEKAKEEVGE